MRKVIISNRAKSNATRIFEYLEAKWSVRIKKEFADKLAKTIDTIRDNPESFPKSGINKNQYRCVVSKQTTLYYRFNSKEIRVLALFDTRMNPKRIKKIN